MASEVRRVLTVWDAVEAFSVRRVRNFLLKILPSCNAAARTPVVMVGHGVMSLCKAVIKVRLCCGLDIVQYMSFENLDYLLPRRCGDTGLAFVWLFF